MSRGRSSAQRALCVLAVALVALIAASRRTALAGEPAIVAADVAAALPPDAVMVVAAQGDLIGDGEVDWALVYTTPGVSPTGFPVPQTHVAVAVPGAGGLSIAELLEPGFTLGGGLEVVAVGSTNAVVFTAGVGAHSQRMSIMRWDGARFSTVFDKESNNPSFQFLDVDGDGVPEVVNRWSAYCEAYVTSPTVLSVYRWDGEAYGDATGDFPALIDEARSGVMRAFERAGDWRPDGVACLHGALAYLDGEEGDASTVASECATAAAIDAAWDEHVDWSPCRTAG
jgi:hypothetical protein